MAFTPGLRSLNLNEKFDGNLHYKSTDGRLERFDHTNDQTASEPYAPLGEGVMVMRSLWKTSDGQVGRGMPDDQDSDEDEQLEADDGKDSEDRPP